MKHFQQVQDQYLAIIPSTVAVLEEYGLRRSFRRAATSEGRARGVSPEDIDLANRWWNFESTRGRRPRLSMRDHFLDIRLLIPVLLKFSESL